MSSASLAQTLILLHGLNVESILKTSVPAGEVVLGFALAGGVITFVIWQVLVGQEFAFAIERTVTVMVIACPHALGLAVPLVVAVCTASPRSASFARTKN